jgi:ribosomal protein S27E
LLSATVGEAKENKTTPQGTFLTFHCEACHKLTCMKLTM